MEKNLTYRGQPTRWVILKEWYDLINLQYTPLRDEMKTLVLNRKMTVAAFLYRCDLYRYPGTKWISQLLQRGTDKKYLIEDVRRDVILRNCTRSREEFEKIFEYVQTQKSLPETDTEAYKFYKFFNLSDLELKNVVNNEKGFIYTE